MRNVKGAKNAIELIKSFDEAHLIVEQYIFCARSLSEFMDVYYARVCVGDASFRHLTWSPFPIMIIAGRLFIESGIFFYRIGTLE